MRIVTAKKVLWVLFILQIAIWFTSNRTKPSFVITPYPPTSREIAFFSFGDTQFYYRKLVFELQNAGDKYGHFTNLKKYNYTRLIRWFQALDFLDPQSRYVPFMAAYYYSIVPSPEKANMIAQYIIDFASQNPEQDWRLLTTALYIYNKNPSKISNEKIQEIGNILLKTQNAPMWARAISAFYLQKSNDICASYRLISQITKDSLILEKENASDTFLVELMTQNIERLQKAGRKEITKCL